MGSRVGLDDFGKSYPYLESISELSAAEPIARRYGAGYNTPNVT
jgi:hypothetical protein